MFTKSVTLNSEISLFARHLESFAWLSKKRDESTFSVLHRYLGWIQQSCEHTDRELGL